MRAGWGDGGSFVGILGGRVKGEKKKDVCECINSLYVWIHGD